MATITATSMTGAEDRAVTETTLDGAADTLTYTAARSPVLILNNPTGGSITPTITGGSATTVTIAGIGDIDVSGGFTTSAIAAAATIAIPLTTIGQYLKGTIDITNGTGLVAQLLEF